MTARDRFWADFALVWFIGWAIAGIVLLPVSGPNNVVREPKEQRGRPEIRKAPRMKWRADDVEATATIQIILDPAARMIASAPEVPYE